jgi:hypothetical protein
MWGAFTTDDVIEARAYVYTWVTAYEEEGPPSPPTLVNGWSNGTWTIGTLQPEAEQQGTLRNITKLRIYRTVVSVAGIATYFFVVEKDFTEEFYVDKALNDEIAENLQLPSTDWSGPPEDLQQIVALPNGVMAGFTGNEVWFCEPYYHHAWPPGYVITTDYPIVGLGVSNGSLVVCTNANPYVITGVSPATMTSTKCARTDPCVARASIVEGDKSVVYMSPTGLISVTPSGQATNVTEQWITRDKWKERTPQKYPRAINLASVYFCFGTTSPVGVSPADASYSQDGFTLPLGSDTESFDWYPQTGRHRQGLVTLTSPDEFNIDNVLTDQLTGVGMLIQNGGVYQYDFTDTAPEIVPYTWRSKMFQENVKRSFSAMRFVFTVPASTPTQAATRKTDDVEDTDWNTLANDQYGIIRVYADNELITVREIRENSELLRIKSGLKRDQWEFEVTSRVEIKSFKVATSAKELRNG